MSYLSILEKIILRFFNLFISRTPYRISFYGGSLDYKDWYSKNPVRIICGGLDYYCYQSVREIPGFFDFKYRICYSKIENAKNINDIQHPSARELIRKFAKNKSIEISYTGDLPSRSGVGSSSAFTVGLINCLKGLNSQFIGRTELAMEAIDLEQNVIKEVVGIQDQCASAFGGLVIIEANCDQIRPRRFMVSSDYKKYLEDHLILGFDGISRSSQLAAKKTVSSITSKSQKNDLMLEFAELNNQGVNYFCEEESISNHSKVTKKIRDIKLQLNGDNKIDRIKEIINNTENAGSLCTRIMGAGGGGFFVCWAPKKFHQQIKNSIKIKTWVNVRFSSQGSELIFTDI